MDSNIDNKFIFQTLADFYIDNPQNEALNELTSLQKIVPFESNPENLFAFEISPFASKLKFERDLETGELLEFKEVFFDDLNEEESRQTAKTSMSLLREPLATNNDILSFNTNSIPFKPAAVDLFCERETIEKQWLNRNESVTANDESNAYCLFDFDDVFSNIPGIDIKLDIGSVSEEEREFYSFSKQKDSAIIDEINDETKIDKIVCEAPETNEVKEEEFKDEEFETMMKKAESIIVTLEASKINEPKKQLESTEWAIVVDINEEVNDFDAKIPKPAFTYPFELDTFQKQAILSLERHENVFVAAHTSAGKTVVAEYAIAMCIRRNKTRVVYTSPIKALSNQKFRDFRQTFGNSSVGLLTGDVQINIDAPCLIMTTEILLKMLYNGSELIRDLDWVIFDEVHYVNDKERGHVWEEVFIMLPDHIGLVMLSATISNVVDFADWLGRARKSKIFVIYTTKRPVPLEHFLYTGWNKQTMDQSFLFIDAQGKFLNQCYYKAVEAKKAQETKQDKKYGPKPRNVELTTYKTLIKFLENNSKLPVIVFTFSRKKCDNNARLLSTYMDLTNETEKGKIHCSIKRSLMKLKSSDKKIPQVREITTLLKKGFGIHHSGILPLLKEITEILFAEGLVKVLFATETFAMGINMPARTVCFDSVMKHDGDKPRNLLSSEYIQMAGRAGRRGKDKTGTVLILCKNHVLEMSELANMTFGKATPLESKFRLTYSMILNLLRSRESLRIESVLEKSFIEHGNQKELQKKEERRSFIEQKLKEETTIACELCSKDSLEFSEKYSKYKSSLAQLMPKVWSQGAQMKKLNLFKEGRLLLFDAESNPFTLGIVLSQTLNSQKELELTVLALDPLKFLACDGKFEKIKIDLINVKLPSIHIVFKHILKINGTNISKEKSLPFIKREATHECIQSLWQFFLKMEHQLPVSSISSLFFINAIDAVKDVGFKDLTFYEKYNALNNLRNNLLSLNCLACESFLDHFSKANEKFKLKKELEYLKHCFTVNSLQQYPDYQNRIKVLKSGGYINDDEILEMKGKIACLMSEHELIITEFLTHNVLGDLEPEEIAAIMSAFVFQEKTKNNLDNLPNKLKRKISEVKKIAAHLGQIQYDFEVVDSIEDVIEELKFGLTEVVLNWGKGMSFAEIMDLTDVQEGIIVRCIQRLDELLTDVRAAAKLFGDQNLVSKFDEASKCIKRDIVFAASLYVTDNV
ncbi:helicase SKI2W-like isoform X2 [Dinothrombium tinctorium]|uniref:Helicase SKI2W-like isoform X2 n=1 Tax=Dinothrombium tinctorium TaxID=1965070 RepID=A0A3S3PEZ8_9ACAR|nr:helicase SKI2W-like isoform X2 [Dinothrombium tinctorium]